VTFQLCTNRDISTLLQHAARAAIGLPSDENSIIPIAPEDGSRGAALCRSEY